MNPAVETAQNTAIISDQMMALVIAGVVIAVLLAVMFVRRGSPSASVDVRLTTVDTRLTAVEEKLKSTSHDVANIKQSIAGLPTKETVHAMEMRLAEMSGQLKGVETATTSTSRAVQRMEEFLLKASAEALANSRNDGSSHR